MFYHTVDGGNPAPPGMYKTPWILGYLLHQLVSRISEPSTVRSMLPLFTDRSAGLERLSKWAQKKNAALMLSASQLGFVSSWRRNLEFAVRNALCFFSGNEMGPLKPRQLSCLKNSGVPWQNSRLWQKKRRENNKYPD